METEGKKIFLEKCFWSNKPKTKYFLTKSSLKGTVQFLIENSCLTFGNVFLLQTVDIPMGIDPASFWANFYLYNYESKYITNPIRTNNFRGRRFHSTFRFVDDLCALNVGGEFG